MLISTPDERPTLFKGHLLVQKGWSHKRVSTVYGCLDLYSGSKELISDSIAVIYVVYLIQIWVISDEVHFLKSPFQNTE